MLIHTDHFYDVWLIHNDESSYIFFTLLKNVVPILYVSSKFLLLCLKEEKKEKHVGLQWHEGEITECWFLAEPSHVIVCELCWSLMFTRK